VRLFVHDYCGHPFPLQLSRWLASRGHTVLHCFSKDIESPRGDFAKSTTGLTIEALGGDQPLAKYDIVRRTLQERKYGVLVASRLEEFRPDVVVSANAPPQIQSALRKAASRCGAAFVYWLQDIYTVMLDQILATKLPFGRRLVSPWVESYEFRVIAQSDAVIVISKEFAARCVRASVPEWKLFLQPNWAPLEEISPTEPNNDWAVQNNLAGKFVFLFSGTLGIKHNPRLLSRLAEAMRSRDDVIVAVVSQGVGRRWLEEEKRSKDLSNLRLFDFQPFEVLPQVLGSASVLTAILEEFAGEGSVPSKILSYLCARRPLLTAFPPRNLASRIISESGAGLLVAHDDVDGFVAGATSFLESRELRQQCASAGRRYAEENFDIDKIGARFLDLFETMRQRATKRGDKKAAGLSLALD
jgi:colanic acid biosynthesis glycosyl transferase WcaI